MERASGSPRDVEAGDIVRGFAYQELRRLARAVRSDRPDATLCTTELLHEAWLKTRDASRLGIEDPLHLRRVVGRAMRQILVDGARRRRVRTTYRLSEEACAAHHTAARGDDPLSSMVLDLDRALKTLARTEPRRAAVVECRFFAGLDVDETARVLDVSTATVKRDWRVTRAWLAQTLDPGHPPPS